MNNLFDLTGKTVLVTGTSGNLGPIWCSTLRDAGAKVFEMDYPEYDVSVWPSVQKARDKCIDAYGTPDIIINNAGIDNSPGVLINFFGNVRRILEVNLEGATLVCEAFIPDMIEWGGGVIINIGSIMGNIGADWRNYSDGFDKPIAYNLSKAGLIQLARSVTTQYGGHNIRCVTIAFGPYDSEKLDKDFKKKFFKNVPLGRGVSKKSLQTTLLFACCCPELAGVQVLIDGGYIAW